MSTLIWTLVVIGFSASLGKTIAEQNQPKADGWLGVWWRGAIWSAVLAGFTFVTTGNPSCSEYGDPIRGGCESYADDGYAWTANRALENAFTVFWKTAAGGSIGLLLLKKELDRLSGGKYVFPGRGFLSARLAADLGEFKGCLAVLVANIFCNHHKSGSEFYADFVGLDHAMRKALDLVRRNPDSIKRAEFLAAFEAAQAELKMNLPVFDSGISGTVFGKTWEA